MSLKVITEISQQKLHEFRNKIFSQIPKHTRLPTTSITFQELDSIPNEIRWISTFYDYFVLLGESHETFLNKCNTLLQPTTRIFTEYKNNFDKLTKVNLNRITGNNLSDVEKDILNLVPLTAYNLKLCSLEFRQVFKYIMMHTLLTSEKYRMIDFPDFYSIMTTLLNICDFMDLFNYLQNDKPEDTISVIKDHCMHAYRIWYFAYMFNKDIKILNGWYMRDDIKIFKKTLAVLDYYLGNLGFIQSLQYIPLATHSVEHKVLIGYTHQTILDLINDNKFRLNSGDYLIPNNLNFEIKLIWQDDYIRATHNLETKISKEQHFQQTGYSFDPNNNNPFEIINKKAWKLYWDQAAQDYIYVTFDNWMIMMTFLIGQIGGVSILNFNLILDKIGNIHITDMAPMARIFYTRKLIEYNNAADYIRLTIVTYNNCSVTKYQNNYITALINFYLKFKLKQDDTYINTWKINQTDKFCFNNNEFPNLNELHIAIFIFAITGNEEEFTTAIRAYNVQEIRTHLATLVGHGLIIKSETSCDLQQSFPQLTDKGTTVATAYTHYFVIKKAKRFKYTTHYALIKEVAWEAMLYLIAKNNHEAALVSVMVHVRKKLHIVKTDTKDTTLRGIFHLEIQAPNPRWVIFTTTQRITRMKLLQKGFDCSF